MTYFTLQLQGAFINRIFVGDEKTLETFQGPGVYILRDKGGNILYIGEAINLWTRLKSHIDGNDDKTGRCVKYIHHIDIYSVGMLERLPLEKLLILQELPPFNEEFTPENGNSKAMKDKMDNYLNRVPKNYYIENWTNYEKLAYIGRQPLELVVLMGAAEIKWGMDQTIPPWTWGEWLTSKQNYLKEMERKGLNNEDILNKVWEVIHDDKSGKRAFLGLVGTPGAHITYDNSLTRTRIDKVSRKKRGADDDSDDSFDSVEFFNSRPPVTLTDTEKEFDNLVNSHKTSGKKYHEVEIYHQKSIKMLEQTEIWFYLESKVYGRYISTPLKREDYPRGEFIFALITHDEWVEITSIIEQEDYPVDVSERDQSLSRRTIELD